ncbi:hypothetical protein MMC26_004796 [Xylographa opegraphella]|nr:hypothetical protein [Xylographa opegraphella]
MTKSTPSKAHLSGEIVQMQQDRIHELEQFIIRSGVDLNHVHQRTIASSQDQALPTPRTSSNFDSTLKSGTKRDHNGMFRPSELTSYKTREAYVVEHDKQTGYIETPMWYSWSEARMPDGETEKSQQKRSDSPQQQAQFSTNYHAALLDPPISAWAIDMLHRHPSPKTASALWTTYLTNVHPLVKLFFDWDKAPMMERAANEPTSLSLPQEALVFAIYFIAVLSLTDTEFKVLFETSERLLLLDDFQSSVEAALERVGYASTSDLPVLQALYLYVLAMRNRARPATLYSLMGIAVRIAERLGLHRDGDLLGLSPMVAEERRRTWWQMQQVEVLIALVVGCGPMSVNANWDTKMPSNLEDSDITPTLATLPPNRPGLTGMSQVLHRYWVGYHIRDTARKGTAWFTSTNVSMIEKNDLMELLRKELVDKFLQHCEPVNPMHLYIQIGVQSFLLAAQRHARQPLMANIRISDMSLADRNEFLKNCMKTMDYYILVQTTPAIARFRWHYEFYFASSSFVYVIVEAHHRAATAEAVSLWATINRVCELHPRLMAAGPGLELSAITHLILRAWQQRQEYLEKQQSQNIEKPWCVAKLEAHVDARNAETVPAGQHDSDDSLDSDLLNFELIDWSAWEAGPAGRFL